MDIDQTFQLAMQHHRAGHLAQAARLYHQVIALDPDLCEAHFNLGNVLADKGQPSAAIIEFRQAIAIKPNFAQAHAALGNILRERGQLDAALAECREAAELNGNLPEIHNNLGNVLKDIGQLNAAIAAFRQANYPQAHSNLIFTLHFHPGFDAAAILDEAKRFDARHAAALTRVAAGHDNDPDPERRLRIGYVGNGFYQHCQALFLVPLLEHHDRERFEVFCYADVPRSDAVTQRMKRRADVWRETSGKSDEELAQIIRGDRIDILVDLTMHMANGRPLLFARKPAPIQVAYLAYPGTTGLSAMDYRISDPYLDEPGDGDASYSEKTVRLETFWCYDPLTEQPAVGSLPALASGGGHVWLFE